MIQDFVRWVAGWRWLYHEKSIKFTFLLIKHDFESVLCRMQQREGGTRDTKSSWTFENETKLLLWNSWGLCSSIRCWIDDLGTKQREKSAEIPCFDCCTVSDEIVEISFQLQGSVLNWFWLKNLCNLKICSLTHSLTHSNETEL